MHYEESSKIEEEAVASCTSEKYPIHHLVSMSCDDFLDLPLLYIRYYDYVSGVVIWTSKMTDAFYKSLNLYHSTILECGARRLNDRFSPSVQVRQQEETVWSANDSIGSASTSSQQPYLEMDGNGLRPPHLAILYAKSESETGAGSSTFRSSKHVEKIELPLPYTKRLLAVVEITSGSTR